MTFTVQLLHIETLLKLRRQPLRLTKGTVDSKVSLFLIVLGVAALAAATSITREEGGGGVLA